MLEILSARSGGPTASINGLYLHSAYNPEREAARFAQESVIENTATLVLLGAGLGHLVQALRKQHPRIRIIAVFYSAEIAEQCLVHGELAAHWRPDQSSLLSFLRREIHELESEGLAILEWKASAQIFPDVSLEANQAVLQLLQEHRGSLATTESMGRLWIRNSFYNFIHLDPVLQRSSAAVSTPILIAASGPSLKRSVDLIKSHRDRLQLWALPSASLFLRENDLKTDLVILTDPGFYATQHLQLSLPRSSALAMPLSAAPGIWRIDARVFFFSQDLFFEKALYGQIGLSPPTILPHGTVAASALDLALQTTRGDVFLAGLDLCYQDIQAHVSPNAFERCLSVRSNRFQPLLQILFDRAGHFAQVRLMKDGSMRSNLALDTYAGWFESVRAKRVYRLFPRRPLSGMATIDAEQFAQKLSLVRKSERIFQNSTKYPDKNLRQERAATVIKDWRQAIKKTLDLSCRSNSVQSFLDDNLQISLAYYTSTAGLLEIKRTLRTGQHSEAVPKIKVLLENELDFFKTLARKIG